MISELLQDILTELQNQNRKIDVLLRSTCGRPKDELLCPFCGGQPVEEPRGPETFGSQLYYISCTKCGAGTAFFDTAGSAWNAWNRRADL